MSRHDCAECWRSMYHIIEQIGSLVERRKACLQKKRSKFEKKMLQEKYIYKNNVLSNDVASALYFTDYPYPLKHAHSKIMSTIHHSVKSLLVV